MLTPALPPDEPLRIQALHELHLLDTPAEERFDRLTRLTQRVLHAPMVLISLVDSERQWIKSRQGLDTCETGRDISFCGHAILCSDIFEIPDSHLDERFADNPLVTGAPHIRFYAGAPLSTADGQRIGTLCILSDQPRRLTDGERQTLRDLADCVESEINRTSLLEQSRTLSLTRRLEIIIRQAQSLFIQEENHSRAFDRLLDDLLELTESEYGFIGDVLYSGDGKPHLKISSVGHKSHNDEARTFLETQDREGMGLANMDTLFGAAMVSGEPVIANDARNDPRGSGVPHGHPPMNAFLGVPVFHGAHLVAMLGLANRNGGYDSHWVDYLKPLTITLGYLIHAERLKQQNDVTQHELARLARIVKETTNGVIITDAQGLTEWVNEGFTRIFGYTLDEMQGKKPRDLIHGPLTDPSTVAAMVDAVERHDSFEADLVNYAKNGQPYWIHLSRSPLLDAEGKLQGYISIQSNITAQRNIEQSLQQFKSTLDQTLDCVFMFDAENLRFFYLNEGALRQVGYSRPELLSMHPFDIKPEFTEAEFRDLIVPLISGEKNALTFETVHRHKEGWLIPVEILLQYVSSPGERAHFVAIVRDVTDRKANEARLKHAATHDALTGLPNRVLFFDRLSQAISQAGRDGNLVGVVLMDLDNFKTINDSFGHTLGDALLVEVASRLGAATRAGDTIARLGGDEIAAVLIGIESRDQLRLASERFLSALSEPMVLAGREISPSASVGYCLFPHDGDTPETLLRHADVAMYAAKSAGRGVSVAYRAEMEGTVEEDLLIISRLRHAMANDGFELFYQPQVDAVSGQIVGAEALLRWTDAELGPVSPGRFIPVAETSGLIIPLGDWVLENACRQIAEWHAMGLNMSVAVNLSPYQLRQHDLVEKIAAACSRNGCPLHLLELEVTESAAMHSPELSRRQFESLAEAGVSLALDDFGTGHSSLARLGQLRVRKLKIDRSFIIETPGNTQYETLVRTTISLGNEMGMKVIAEGVETEDQRDFLVQHGCTAYQGWLFSKAVPAEIFAELVLK